MTCCGLFSHVVACPHTHTDNPLHAGSVTSTHTASALRDDDSPSPGGSGGAGGAGALWGPALTSSTVNADRDPALRLPLFTT